jgi:peptide/nickel transport system ATP-binding protein
MLLSIQDLRVAFRLGKVDGVVQRFEAVQGRELRRARKHHGGTRRRIGLGQERHRHVDPQPAARQRRTLGGSISFQGRDLLAARRRELQRCAGRDIACVFQDPMTSLNPVLHLRAADLPSR